MRKFYWAVSVNDMGEAVFAGYDCRYHAEHHRECMKFGDARRVTMIRGKRTLSSAEDVIRKAWRPLSYAVSRACDAA